MLDVMGKRQYNRLLFLFLLALVSEISTRAGAPNENLGSLLYTVSYVVVAEKELQVTDACDCYSLKSTTKRRKLSH